MNVIMKRNILVILLVIFSFFGVYGQSSSSPIDLVLLLDTSSAMAPSNENVNSYITGSFLSEFLRIGDTFHLIAYSSTPRLDAARRISGRGDVETIIGRMLLQYPVENGSNLSAAIRYAEEYITTLPARPKKIVLVGTEGNDTGSLVNAAKQRLSSRNATLDFVPVRAGQRLTNLPSSGRPAPAVARPSATPSQTGTQRPAATPSQTDTRPSATTPSQTDTRPSATTPSQTDTRPSATTPSQTDTRPSATTPSQTDTRPSTSQDDSRVTGGQSTGEQSTTGRTATDTTVTGSQDASEGASQDVRRDDSSTKQSGTAGGMEQRAAKSGQSLMSSLPLIIGFIIIALLILGLIIFLASRRLGSSPNRVMASVSSSASKPAAHPKDEAFVDHSKDLAKYAAGQNRQRTTPYADRPVKHEAEKPIVINPSGPLLLNLFVEDQNTAIGKRNIHSLKSGYNLSVGGGKSDDFYIFLVPIPSHIGEIHRNGAQCSFIPRKPKYFPDLGSNELKDCINKTIRIVSDRNYEIRFRFEMYEDPLIALNRILMSVNVPG